MTSVCFKEADEKTYTEEAATWKSGELETELGFCRTPFFPKGVLEGGFYMFLRPIWVFLLSFLVVFSV